MRRNAAARTRPFRDLLRELEVLLAEVRQRLAEEANEVPRQTDT